MESTSCAIKSCPQLATEDATYGRRMRERRSGDANGQELESKGTIDRVVGQRPVRKAPSQSPSFIRFFVETSRTALLPHPINAIVQFRQTRIKNFRKPCEGSETPPSPSVRCCRGTSARRALARRFLPHHTRCRVKTEKSLLRDGPVASQCSARVFEPRPCQGGCQRRRRVRFDAHAPKNCLQKFVRILLRSTTKFRAFSDDDGAQRAKGVPWHLHASRAPRSNCPERGEVST